MTGEEAINEALSDGLNVAGDGTFPYAQEANDRLRATWRGQAILTDFWRRTDWRWRRRSEPFVVSRGPGETTVDLGSDFGEKGKYMTVVCQDSGLPVLYKDPQTVQIALNYGIGGRRSGRPLIYTVEYTFNEEFGDIYRLRMAPQQPSGSSQALEISGYLMKEPTFADDELELPVPSQYHRTVILRLLKREFMKTVGDARDKQELQEIESYIDKAVADERPIPGAKRSPRFGKGRLRNSA